MASGYRLNRYNWLGQKLLTHHNYDHILELKQRLAKQQGNTGVHSSTCEGPNLLLSSLATGEQNLQQRQRISDHMIYLSSLALIQTSTHLDEVIYSVQQLNFENNNQYFLLLCRCLLYLGNHESVIALCERVIAKEANNTTIDRSETIQCDDSSAEQEQESSNLEDQSAAKYGSLRAASLSEDCSPLLDSEFKKLFQGACNNHLITEPRLWFILGLCLEYQGRLKDALAAYKVSSNLALGSAGDDIGHHQHDHKHNHHRHQSHTDGRLAKANIASLNNFHEPHLKYAQLCIRLRGDFKRASQVLSRAVAKFPQNYTLNPYLSLISCSNINSNLIHLNRAIEMLTTLDSYSVSNRNPSSSYNNLALRCQQRLLENSPTRAMSKMMVPESASDDSRFKLHYLLIRAHLQVNSIVQNSSQLASLFSCSPSSPRKPSSNQLSLDKKTEQLIELMRGSDVSCWQSSSLWNNLAVSFMMRGKLIASLTCLLKAQQLDPLDWRICYNMALTCVQIGLVQRALCSLIAAKRLHDAHNLIGPAATRTGGSSVPQLITTLMAICFDRLGQVEESRRLHIEAIRLQASDTSGRRVSTPIFSIINYLIFLHKNVESDDPQTFKLKLHLLDIVEQLWLQRNQNDCQFNIHLLNKAHRIGQILSDQDAGGRKSGARKTYAWMKVDDKILTTK